MSKVTSNTRSWPSETVALLTPTLMPSLSLMVPVPTTGAGAPVASTFCAVAASRVRVSVPSRMVSSTVGTRTTNPVVLLSPGTLTV